MKKNLREFHQALFKKRKIKKAAHVAVNKGFASASLNRPAASQSKPVRGTTATLNQFPAGPAAATLSQFWPGSSHAKPE